MSICLFFIAHRRLKKKQPLYEQYCSNLLGSCKCGNELSGSIKCGEFLDLLKTG